MEQKDEGKTARELNQEREYIQEDIMIARRKRAQAVADKIHKEVDRARCEKERWMAYKYLLDEEHSKESEQIKAYELCRANGGQWPNTTEWMKYRAKINEIEGRMITYDGLLEAYNRMIPRCTWAQGMAQDVCDELEKELDELFKRREKLNELLTTAREAPESDDD
ncbi:WD repeat domain-containing protein [Metarhizium brunneum]